MTPRLSVFFMVILLESAGSLCTTCVVLVIHHRGEESEEYPMPSWVRKVFVQILARKLGYLKGDERNRVDSIEEMENHAYEVDRDRAANIKRRKRVRRRNGGSVSAVVRVLQKHIQKSLDEIKNDDKKSDVNKDWKIVGKIVDLLSFVVFFLTLVISSIAILVVAYNN